jgi:hypothetical protein
MSIWKAATNSRTLLRTLVTVLFVCAIAGLVLTGVFGFETPNSRLLLLSSGLLLAALVAVPVHLAVTRTLTRPQKRVWLRQLTGRRAAWVWGEYLTCDDLQAAAITFAEGDAVSGIGKRKSARPGDAP